MIISKQKAEMETKGKRQKGDDKAGGSSRRVQERLERAAPDWQEDRKGLPYLIIQAVIPDGLNIYLIYMTQHI